MEIIEIKDLKKAYGIKSVLKGISISVRKGTIHGFIGPNGAGKTTTIKSLMGAVIPDSGEIYITGKKRDKVEDINKKIGYMFEKLDFSNDLTVEEFIHLVGRERDISSKNVEEYLQKSEL
jgi:ABC-type multidrug transport system ATPase subunit